MLDQALTLLAASGGAAVVSAAGTDAWGGLRGAVAGWLGRGDTHRERAELARLDRTAAALEAVGEQAEAERARQRAAWQAHVEGALASLAGREQLAAAGELRRILAEHGHPGGVSAGPGGVAAGGDVTVRAEGGSVAAGSIQGGVHLGPPSPPAPDQG